MNTRRIIGRTVGTTLNPRKLQDELDLGMPSADTMEIISELESSDSVIVHNPSEGETKQIRWGDLQTLIKNELNKKIISNGITDEAKTDFVATVPELENDAVIALVSDIENALKAYYTTTEVDERISSIPKFSIEVVDTLPTENISTSAVYLLIAEGDTENLYTEYIYVNGTWEKLGEQTVDLTGYVTTDDLGSAVNTALTAAKESGEFDGRGIVSVELDEDSNELYINYTDGTSDTIELEGRGIVGMDIDEEGYLHVVYAGEEHQSVEVGKVRGRGIEDVFIKDGNLMATFDDEDVIYDLGNVVGEDGRSIEDVYIRDGHLFVTFIGEAMEYDLGNVVGDKGDAGANGKDGSKWFSGAANLTGYVPIDTVSDAVEGDWYLNTDTYNIFVAERGYWCYAGTLKGEQGIQGIQGEKGADGYTPVKGTDYFTAADKAEMVHLVLSALPTWNGGSY